MWYNIQMKHLNSYFYVSVGWFRIEIELKLLEMK